MSKDQRGALLLLLAAIFFQPLMGHEGEPDMCDPVGPFGYPGLQLPADEIGEWAPWQLWPLRAVHMTLLHTGQVLVWSGKELELGDPTTSFLWDPVTEELEELPLVSAELFCAGHSTLADGRVLAVGGTAEEGIGWGPKHNAIYDPKTRTWTRVADMAYGRYYPTATTMGDGRVLAVSGNIHPPVGELPTERADIPELYDPASDTWIQLETAEFFNPMYPHDFLLSDGRLFFAGPGTDTQYLDIAEQTWSGGPHSLHTNSDASTVIYESGKLL